MRGKQKQRDNVRNKETFIKDKPQPQHGLIPTHKESRPKDSDDFSF